MKSIIKRLAIGLVAAGVILALGSLLPIKPVIVKDAQAAATVLCAPNPVEGANARTIGGVNSPVPSQSIYILNGQGCAVIAQQDVGYFLSIGFTAGPPFAPNCLFTTGVLAGTTSVQICTLPPSTYIQHIIVNNLTANAITGGLTFGTASGGTQIASVALACGANCLVFEPDSSIAAGRIFSTTAPTPVFVQAVTAWNSANVTITVVLGYF